MAVFTIKAPDGRVIQIKANDQATALRGAQEWAAANPAQQPGNVAEPSPAFEEALSSASANSQSLALPEARPDLIGSTAATLGGMVNNGLPVIGPMAQNLTDAIVGTGMQLTGNGTMEEYRADARARREQLAQANPIANIAGGVAGGIGTFGAAAKLPGAASALGLTGSLPARAVNSGVSALGIGTADNIAKGQTPVDALTNATAPAAVASVLPVVGAGIRAGAQGIANASTKAAQRRLTNAAIKDAPAAVDLKAVARGMFKEVDESGAALKTDFFAQKVYQAAQRAEKELIDSELDGPAVRLYNILADRTRRAYESGKGITLGELHNMRQIAQDIVMKGGGDRTGRFADQIVDLIDDIAANLKPAQMQFPGNRIGGNVNEMGKWLMNGIGTWSRARRVGLIEEAIYKAQNQASGVENGLRTQFRALLQNPKTRNLFSAAEKEAIEKVANGTGLSNLSRLLGTFGFDLGSGRNAIGGALGLLAGGPVGAIIGTGARKASEVMATRAGQRAANVVATPNIPTATPRLPSPMLLQGADILERVGKGALLSN